MIINEEFDSFKKDFKKLNKKYRSLSVDFERFKTALETDGINLTGVVQIPMGGKCSLRIYKARKFRCQSLEGKGNRSGIRIIFSAEKTCTNNGDKWDYYLIEIYYKGEQENHDEKRIMEFEKQRFIQISPPKPD